MRDSLNKISNIEKLASLTIIGFLLVAKYRYSEVSQPTNNETLNFPVHNAQLANFRVWLLRDFSISEKRCTQARRVWCIDIGTQKDLKGIQRDGLHTLIDMNRQIFLLYVIAGPNYEFSLTDHSTNFIFILLRLQNSYNGNDLIGVFGVCALENIKSRSF